MQKKFFTIIALLSLALLLTGCQCEHEWEEATCTTPKSCVKCGETEGEALGHNWQNATCQTPETCSRCEETRGTVVDHTWLDATCTNPKTCSFCGLTEGQALGHQERDWEVVETDMVKATEVLKKYCAVCNTQLDRKVRDIDTLHDTYHFLMTPQEFTTRLSNELQSVADSNLLAISGASGGDFACGIFTDNSAEKAGILLFVGDGDSIAEHQKNDVCFDGGLGAVQGSDNTAICLLSLLQACDPSLSFSDAKDIGTEILLKGELTKNGITYIVSVTGDNAVICFTLSD